MANDKARFADVVEVTDYVANGSFAALKANVTYCDRPDYAILARLVDHNARWAGDHVYVDKASYDFLKKSSLEPGDVVIANVGANAGTVFRIPDLGLRMTLGPNAVRCRPKSDDLDRDFLYYFLVSPMGQELLRTIVAGSAQPKFNKTDLRSLTVALPALPRQRSIAHILGTLDDKIELNRRMGETLESMARALFKSWFVDFDPVRAKAEGRDTGLPKQISDLFPDRLVDSELGPIPAGWEVRPLSYCADVARGLSYKGSGLTGRGKGVPMHNLNSIYEGGGYKYEGIKYYTGDYKPEHTVATGDVVVANTEQGHNRLLIGHAAIVPTRFGGKSLFSHHIYKVRPKPDCALTPSYLCHLLNTPAAHDLVSRYANGTTVNMLPKDALEIPRIVVPARPLIVQFSGVADAALRRHEKAVEESQALTSIRDALLPKLVSGQLRVRDAERSMERVE